MEIKRREKEGIVRRYEWEKRWVAWGLHVLFWQELIILKQNFKLGHMACFLENIFFTSCSTRNRIILRNSRSSLWENWTRVPWDQSFLLLERSFLSSSHGNCSFISFSVSIKSPSTFRYWENRLPLVSR